MIRFRRGEKHPQMNANERQCRVQGRIAFRVGTTWGWSLEDCLFCRLLTSDRLGLGYLLAIPFGQARGHCPYGSCAFWVDSDH